MCCDGRHCVFSLWTPCLHVYAVGIGVSGWSGYLDIHTAEGSPLGKELVLINEETVEEIAEKVFDRRTDEANKQADDRVRKIIKESTREAIREEFMRIGIDSSDPIEQQRRAQAVRTMVTIMDKGGITAWVTFVTLAAGGLVMATWQYIVGK